MVDDNLINSLGDIEVAVALNVPPGDAANDLHVLVKSDEVQDLSPNAIVKGRISGMAGDDYLVELGQKSEGILEKGEFDEPKTVKMGDAVSVLVEEVDPDTGSVRISKRKADRIINWEAIMNSKKEGDPVTGKVTKKIKGGLLVDIGVPMFLPASQVDIRRPGEISDWVGRSIDAVILTIDPERRNIVISCRKMINERGPDQAVDPRQSPAQVASTVGGEAESPPPETASVTREAGRKLLAQRDLRFEVLESPPDCGGRTVAVLHRVWLPFFLWPDVPIVRQVSRQLMAAERFVLEAAVALGSFTGEDLEEITSIPRLAVHRIARRLASQRTLLVLPDKRYAVQVAEAQAALERQAIIEPQPGKLTFLFLPRSDDLIAFGEGTQIGDAPRRDRIIPLGQAPVPNGLQHQKKHAFLQHRVRERLVLGLPNEVVDVEVPETDSEIPAFCPAYQGHGYIEEHDGEFRAFLNLYGHDASRRGNQEPELASFPLRLFGSLSQTGEWVALSRVMEHADAQEQAWFALNANYGVGASAPRSTHTQAATWNYHINAEMADCIAKAGRPLVPPLGLSLYSDDACVSFKVTLSPSDPASAQRFAIDDVVIRLQTSTDISVEGVKQMMQEAMIARGVGVDSGLGVDAVQDRLWQLKHYRQIYALRRAEDMCYE